MWSPSSTDAKWWSPPSFKLPVPAVVYIAQDVFPLSGLLPVSSPSMYFTILQMFRLTLGWSSLDLELPLIWLCWEWLQHILSQLTSPYHLLTLAMWTKDLKTNNQCAKRWQQPAIEPICAKWVHLFVVPRITGLHFIPYFWAAHVHGFCHPRNEGSPFPFCS